MPAAFQLNVKGQVELERAFRGLRKDVLAGMRPELRKIGEIVSKDAEVRAVSEITNIGSAWSRMRVGVIVRGVYVAPRSRRSGGSPRPNLAGLLLNRAMQPAVDANEEKVMEQFNHLIDISAAKEGFY